MTTIRSGDPSRFSLESELVPDPDQGGRPAIRASWGTLRISVGGRNLSEGRASSGDLLDAAQVHLLPVARWIVQNWDHLLHEERLPTPGGALSSASWHVESLGDPPRNADRLDRLLSQREHWWARHGLGAALPDFRIPDLHFRRFGQDVELSWDDREWRSVDGGIHLVQQPGSAHLPVAEVVGVLAGWCGDLLAQLSRTEAADEVAEVQRLFADLDSEERQIARLEIAAGIDLAGAARRVRRLAGIQGDDLRDTVRALLGVGAKLEPGRFARFTTPVLLYRSSSPALSEADLTALLGLCGGEQVPPEASFLGGCREPAPCRGTPNEITQDGYERGIAAREFLGIDADRALTGDLDLEAVLLPRLGVRTRDIVLEDPGVDGVALLGPMNSPTIAVNRSGRFSKTNWGRRMTLAHELCHLLHDGNDDGVGVVSNPWAQYALERRANAFAAMFLAPEAAIAGVLSRDAQSWSAADLRLTMRALGVGATTLTRQLQNLGWVTESERKAWMDEFSLGGG